MFEALQHEGIRKITAVFVFVYIQYMFNMCECRAAGLGCN